MLPHSVRLSRALTDGTPLKITPVLEWSPDWRNWYPLTVLSGSHTQDRTSTVRWTMSATVEKTVKVGFDGIHAQGPRLRLRMAISFLGSSPEYLPAGLYSITSAVENRNNITLAGSSFEQDVIDSTFPVARNFPDTRWMTYRRQAEKLITEAVPDARYVWDDRLARLSAQPMPALAVDSDRWSVIHGQANDSSIATALAADALCDASGAFSFIPRPSLLDAPVWEISEDTHTKITSTRELNRTGVFNLINVTGTPADGGATIGPVFVWDDDPHSPTYAGPDPVNHPEKAGLFGVKPYRYDSPLLTTARQGWQVGRAILADVMGESRTVSFTGRFHPAQEAGDVVLSTRDDNTMENHLVDSINYSWASGAASYTTRSTKQEITVSV
jgi:hypothetical protein